MDENNKYIIRGSYSSSVNYQYLNVINIFYENNLQELINENIEEINKMEKNINEIQIININLLQNIYLFEKRCKFINATISNTTNFIIANFNNVCFLLNKYINNYNNNIIKIEELKNKINDLNIIINSLKNNL